MKPYIDLTGRQIGFLRVLSLTRILPKDGTYWRCGCWCGNYTEVIGTRLRSNKILSASCGRCYLQDKYPGEYSSWKNMWSRCNNSDNKDYKDYGGRGIIVCSRWASFQFFLEDMGLREGDKNTIERKNNEGDYEPSNCKWSSRLEQAYNRRSNFTIA